MSYPTAAIVVEAAYTEYFVFGMVAVFEGSKAVLEGGGEGFVGIDAKNPFVRSEGVGKVFLTIVTFPGMGDETSAERVANLFGGIG